MMIMMMMIMMVMMMVMMLLVFVCGRVAGGLASSACHRFVSRQTWVASTERYPNTLAREQDW